MSLLAQVWLRSMNALAEKSSVLYTVITSIFAIIGYGYVFIFPILTVSSLGLLIDTALTKSPMQWGLNDWLASVAMLLTGAACAWISSKIIKIKPDLPAGKPLLAKDFPALFDRITEICTSFGAPEIHHVKLTPHFRIEIIRTPVGGFPFKHSNTLLIGLPVMSSTSPLQLKLLLARQIGHLALARKSLARKLIYLQHTLKAYKHVYGRSWQPETILLRLFFCWYSPFFNLTSTKIAQLESIHKDACMLEITPSDSVAAVIIDFHIKKLFIKTRFWPALNNSAFKLENPPYLPYANIKNFIEKNLDQNIIKLMFEEEFDHEIELDSKIPNLKSRLHAIGYDEFIASDDITDYAIDYFFENQANDICKQLDNVWSLKNKKIWAEKYNQGIEEKKQLAEMRNQITKSLLSDEEILEYIRLIDKYVSPEKTLPLYKEIVTTNPQDGDLCLDLGRILLKANDSSGINLLKTSMAVNPNYTVECCNQIVEYLVNHGDNKEAQNYRRIILEYQADN